MGARLAIVVLTMTLAACGQSVNLACPTSEAEWLERFDFEAPYDEDDAVRHALASACGTAPSRPERLQPDAVDVAETTFGHYLATSGVNPELFDTPEDALVYVVTFTGIEGFGSYEVWIQADEGSILHTNLRTQPGPGLDATPTPTLTPTPTG